jgi:hypothetical protein
LASAWIVSHFFRGENAVTDPAADTTDTVEACWQFPEFLMTYNYRGFNNFRTVQNRPFNHGICFHGNRATMVHRPLRDCEKMGLAPSENPENLGKSVVAKVPVPIFSQPLSRLARRARNDRRRRPSDGAALPAAPSWVRIAGGVTGR